MPSVSLIIFGIVMLGLSVVPTICVIEVAEMELGIKRYPHLSTFFINKKKIFLQTALVFVLIIFVSLVTRKFIFRIPWNYNVIVPICILILKLIIAYKISQLNPSKESPTLSKR